MKNTDDKKMKKRANPAWVIAVGVAALIWVLSLDYALGVRRKCARLAEKDAENRRLTVELASTRATVAAHKAFIASLPIAESRRPSIKAYIPENLHPRILEESPIQTDRHGLQKAIATLRWSSISGEAFAEIITAVGKASPPFRLESATLTKAPGTAEALTIEAVFSSYSK